MGHIGLTPSLLGSSEGGRRRGATLRRRSPRSRLRRPILLGAPRRGEPGGERCHEEDVLGTDTEDSGGSCDGQLLIMYDLLGLFHLFAPKFVKKYEGLAGDTRRMVEEYCRDVRKGAFPV